MSDPGNRIEVQISSSTDESGFDRADARVTQFGKRVQETNPYIERYIDTSSVLGQRMAAVTGYAAPAAQALEGVGSGARAAGAATRELGVPVATATREFRALFDELSSGYWRRAPGTLAIIANRVLGLSGTTLAATIGVAALAAGFVYLAYRTDEADMALEKMAIHANFAGNAQLTKAAMGDLTQELDHLTAVSKATAESIIGDWSKMADMTKQEVEGLSIATTEYMALTGEKAPEAVKELSRAFDAQKLSIAQIQSIFPGLSAQEAFNFQQTQKMGNSHQTAAAMLDILTAKAHPAAEHIAELNSHTFASVSNFARMTAAVIEDYSGGLIPLSSVLEGVIKYWNAFTGAISGALAWVHQMTGGLHGLTQAERVHNAILAENQAKVAAQEAATKKAADGLRNQKASQDEIVGSALKMGETIHSTSTEIDEMRKKIQTIQAGMPFAKGAALDELKKDLRGANEELALLQKREAAPGIHAAKEAGEEAIQAAREQVSEINANERLGGQERLDEVREVWAQLLATTKLTGQQRVQVEIAMNESIAQAHKAAATEELEIANNNISTQLQLAKLGFQQQRDALQEQVAEHLITKTQELEKLKEIAKAEGQAEIDAITEQQKSYAHDSAFFLEKENEKRVIAAQTAVELARLANQEASAENQAAKQAAEYWKKAFQETTSAEDSFIENVTSGHKSALAALGLALGDFVKKEIEADLQYFTAHLFYNQAELAADHSLAQEGLLLHAAMESGKTSATAAGAATRAEATASGAAAGNAAEATADSTSIINSAYTSAASAYRSVMQAVPPPINLILAPLAAAGTFAAVAAYNTITRLETGAWEVPKLMPAILHPGEQVVPRNFAEGLRQTGTLGGGRGGPSGGDMHLHYNPVFQSQDKSLRELAEKDSSFMRSWFASQVRDGLIDPRALARPGGR